MGDDGTLYYTYSKSEEANTCDIAAFKQHTFAIGTAKAEAYSSDGRKNGKRVCLLEIGLRPRHPFTQSVDCGRRLNLDFVIHIRLPSGERRKAGKQQCTDQD